MEFQKGDKVTYTPTGERGIVKGFTERGHLYVVFNCGGDWDNYENYTAAMCHLRHIKEGWQ